MTTKFRSTALATALVAFSVGALAGPVMFEGPWEKGVAAKDPPVEFLAEGGFTFTGAWGYKAGMFMANDVLPKAWDLSQSPIKCADASGEFSEALCNTTGFIMNRARGEKAQIIRVDVDPKRLQYIENVSIRLYHETPTGATVTARNAAGGFENFENITPGNLVWTSWNSAVKLANATTLEFNFGEAYVLGLDNLDITLSAAPGGGATVPEPASYALVGLALLAAGAARRRYA